MREINRRRLGFGGEGVDLSASGRAGGSVEIGVERNSEQTLLAADGIERDAAGREVQKRRRLDGASRLIELDSSGGLPGDEEATRAVRRVIECERRTA